MSNALQTLIQSNVGLIETGLDEDTLALAGTGGTKRISIEGGRFRKIVNGKEVSVNTDTSMDIIFVKVAHTPSSTFYASQYKKGVKISPTCWSSDAKTPDADVDNPVASSCDKCPHAVKGSGQGGQGRACRLSHRTAAVLANDPEGDVYQLVLPATSVWGEEKNDMRPFRPYVSMLAGNNISLGRVVTRMTFDLDFAVPKLLFSPVAGVSPEFRETIARQGKSQAAEKAIKLTVFKSDKGDDVEVAAEAAAEVVAEPVRQAKAEAVPVEDVSNVIKKWSKK